jgi:diaminohydroxyphosphoribosylaminopyrimidine deaminase/5-amino-6-(5-phosphoribosylamino)uracil reductase
MTVTANDLRFMANTIRLARRGLYGAPPNPRVGCMIVRDDRVIAEGFHARAGSAHAEAAALAGAREDVRGATAYVSLEPCAHQGRTPPCAEALLNAGITRVVAACEDPNPLVAGKGLARLRAAGIDTVCGVLADEARALNPGFFRRMQEGVPQVRCKLAMSLDGRTAMASGESRWITGTAARADGQRQRARSCVVLSGIGTVLADDPRLDVRAAEAGGADARQPLRVVADSCLRLPVTAQVLAVPGTCLVAAARPDASREAALRAAGAEVLQVAGEDGRIDLRALLRALATRGCNEVLVEAGATLAGALAAARLVDEYLIYMAPVLLGSRARGLLELPLDTMAERRGLRITEVVAVGSDWRITATPA